MPLPFSLPLPYLVGLFLSPMPAPDALPSPAPARPFVYLSTRSSAGGGLAASNGDPGRRSRRRNPQLSGKLLPPPPPRCPLLLPPSPPSLPHVSPRRQPAAARRPPSPAGPAPPLPAAGQARGAAGTGPEGEGGEGEGEGREGGRSAEPRPLCPEAEPEPSVGRAGVRGAGLPAQPLAGGWGLRLGAPGGPRAVPGGCGPRLGTPSAWRGAACPQPPPEEPRPAEGCGCRAAPTGSAPARGSSHPWRHGTRRLVPALSPCTAAPVTG